MEPSVGFYPLVAAIPVDHIVQRSAIKPGAQIPAEQIDRAVPVLIPFFAFALGTGIDFGSVWRSGLLGIALGLAVVAFSGVLLYLGDRVTGGNGIAGGKAYIQTVLRGANIPRQGELPPIPPSKETETATGCGPGTE